MTEGQSVRIAGKVSLKVITTSACLRDESRTIAWPDLRGVKARE